MFYNFWNAQKFFFIHPLNKMFKIKKAYFIFWFAQNHIFLSSEYNDPWCKKHIFFKSSKLPFIHIMKKMFYVKKKPRLFSNLKSLKVFLFNFWIKCSICKNAFFLLLKCPKAFVFNCWIKWSICRNNSFILFKKLKSI